MNEIEYLEPAHLPAGCIALEDRDGNRYRRYLETDSVVVEYEGSRIVPVGALLAEVGRCQVIYPVSALGALESLERRWRSTIGTPDNNEVAWFKALRAELEGRS